MPPQSGILEILSQYTIIMDRCSVYIGMVRVGSGLINRVLSVLYHKTYRIMMPRIDIPDVKITHVGIIFPETTYAWTTHAGTTYAGTTYAGTTHARTTVRAPRKLPSVALTGSGRRISDRCRLDMRDHTPYSGPREQIRLGSPPVNFNTQRFVRCERFSC
jgi:hypothetical protein